jgi:c-di-GMP-binding flagellar brake protein YcgR
MKYLTEIDLGSDSQMNFHVGDGISLEERRRFYKVPVDFDGISTFMIRDDEVFPFNPPIDVHFFDLNLGGIFFNTPSQVFQTGDQLQVVFINGEMTLMSEVLRVQKNPDDTIKGYGARFVSITSAQEERLSRYIFDCQLEERERRRKREELMGM